MVVLYKPCYFEIFCKGYLAIDEVKIIKYAFPIRQPF